MKKSLLFLQLVLLFSVPNLVAQTLLETETESRGIDFNLPKFLSASQNTKNIYPADITEENPIPEVAQTFGSKPAFGDTYINSMLGTITSILTYENEKCVVFVYISPSSGVNNYSKIVRDSTILFTLNNVFFGRIKHDFKYGNPLNDANALEALELYSMLTHYPYEKVQEMFNANVMVSYPLNLRGNKYKDKYSRGRAVIIGKKGNAIYLYFMMTDESVLNFEKYLDDFSKVFWYTGRSPKIN